MTEMEDNVYKNCCRLCLSSNAETLKSVFEEIDRNKALRERILAFLSVDIKENDRLSKLVCDACMMKITNWSEFRRNCFKNQTILENYTEKFGDMHESSLEVKEEVLEDLEIHSEEDDVEITYAPLRVKTEPTDPEKDENEDEEIQHDEPNELETSGNTERNNEKIEFAAGLRLIKSDTTPISMENLSRIEGSYIEKCKAMVLMYRTLVCACHNVSHPNVKGLLSHLRSVKIWFPVFTCYHCMITFTDRSSSGKHMHKCPNKNLETLVKLSNLKKRSALKTRIYQNYRCVKCRFLYTFHEDFCKHVDEEHCDDTTFTCTCNKTFESLEDYKDHVYVSCLVEYYCDICNAAVKSLDEFVNHAETNHDQSEGFVLLQDDNYKRRSFIKVEPRENMDILGKRRSSTYGRVLNDDGVDEPVIEEENPLKKFKPTSSSSRNMPTKCLKCDNVYSCYANMMRHYRKHTEKAAPVAQEPRVNSLYRCPDCHTMFNAHDWKDHKATHEPQKCEECAKHFMFKSELDAHRSVHLNLKVYRDAKTHAYKTTLLTSANSDAPVCDICNIVCENFEDLESHKLCHEELEEDYNEEEEPEANKDVVSAKYSCIPCNKHYTGYSGLWDHNKKKHSDKQTTNLTYPRRCDECEKVITSGSAFASHKAMHRRVRDETVRISTQPPKRNTQPDEDYFTCKRCFKVFSNKYNLKKHMVLHGINVINKSPKKVLTCELCNIAFNNPEEHRAHFEEEHSNFIVKEEEEEDDGETDEFVHSVLEEFNSKPYVFTCDICVQTFNTKNALKLHKETHTSETIPNKKIVAATCKYCRIGFETVEKHIEHMVNEHDEHVEKKTSKSNGNKPTPGPGGGFACKICKKTFLSQPAMYAHQGWHKRAKNEAPPVYNKSEILTPKVQQRNLACSRCGLELPNDTALQIHILEKHGNITALLAPRCEPCNQEFATQTEYENHKKLHEIVENQKKMSVQQQAKAQYPCNICGSSFSKNETLQAHIRLNHRDVFNATALELKCQLCGRVFDKLSALNNHMKVHEKQKTVTASPKPLYFCSICNMGFNVPKELRAHTITAHPF